METPAETSFWTFITRLQALADNPGIAASYVESYLEAHAGNFPIVEGNTAHFRCRRRMEWLRCAQGAYETNRSWSSALSA